jgi:hypothetical protein
MFEVDCAKTPACHYSPEIGFCLLKSCSNLFDSTARNHIANDPFSVEILCAIGPVCNQHNLMARAWTYRICMCLIALLQLAFAIQKAVIAAAYQVSPLKTFPYKESLCDGRHDCTVEGLSGRCHCPVEGFGGLPHAIHSGLLTFNNICVPRSWASLQPVGS